MPPISLPLFPGRPERAPPEDERHHGRILFVNQRAGYGFIHCPTEQPRDYYFSLKDQPNVPAGHVLHRYQQVAFDVAPDPITPGHRSRAVNLTPRPSLTPDGLPLKAVALVLLPEGQGLDLLQNNLSLGRYDDLQLVYPVRLDFPHLPGYALLLSAAELTTAQQHEVLSLLAAELTTPPSSPSRAIRRQILAAPGQDYAYEYFGTHGLKHGATPL